MRRISFSYGQLSIPTVTIDETQIYGTGGVYAPVLVLMIRLDGRVAEFKPHEAMGGLVLAFGYVDDSGVYAVGSGIMVAPGVIINRVIRY